MKKIVSFLFLAFLFLLTGCQSDGVSEGNLIGSWQLIAGTEDGMREDLESQNIIYEFLENHDLYISNAPTKGRWSLNGNKLYISRDDIEWTVTKLTTTSMELCYDEYDEGEHFLLLYEFRRVQ